MSGIKLRLVSIVLVLVFVPLLSSCYVLSLNPLVPPDSAVLEEHITGKWHMENRHMLDVKSNSDGCYSIEYSSSDEKAAHLQGCMGLFDGELVLDLRPDDKWLEEHIPEGLYGFFISGHAFLRVRASDDTLQLQAMDVGWLKNAVGKKKAKLTISPSGSDEMILTGGTEELRRFLSRYASNSGMWDTDSEHSWKFERVGPAQN